MRFKFILFLIYIVLTLITLILPYSLNAYLLIIVMMVLSVKFIKTNVIYLLVYFPIRPIISEINTGLTFLGDAVLISSCLTVLYFERKHFVTLVKTYSFFIYFILFLILGSISALFVSNVNLMPLLVELRALAIMTLFVIVFSSTIWNKNDYLTLINASLITAFGISVFAIFEKLLGKLYVFPSAWANWDLSTDNADRVYGTLGNPNVLSMYLLFIVVLSFLPILNKSSLKPFILLIQIFILSAVFLTASRGAVLSFLMGYLIYVLLAKEWRSILKVGLLTTLSFFLVYYPVDYFSVDQISKDQDNIEQHSSKPPKDSLNLVDRLQLMFKDKTIEASKNWGRIYIVIKGVEIFQDHPVIGTGFATYGDSATQTYSSPIYNQYDIKGDIYSDNQYIHLLVSTGIVGLVLLIIFLVRLMIFVWRHYLYDDKFLFLFITITFLVSCLFYNTLEDKTFMMLYFSLMGILYHRSRGIDHA